MLRRGQCLVERQQVRFQIAAAQRIIAAAGKQQDVGFDPVQFGNIFILIQHLRQRVARRRQVRDGEQIVQRPHDVKPGIGEPAVAFGHDDRAAVTAGQLHFKLCAAQHADDRVEPRQGQSRALAQIVDLVQFNLGGIIDHRHAERPRGVGFDVKIGRQVLHGHARFVQLAQQVFDADFLFHGKLLLRSTVSAG